MPIQDSNYKIFYIAKYCYKLTRICIFSQKGIKNTKYRSQSVFYSWFKALKDSMNVICNTAQDNEILKVSHDF